MIHFVGLLVFFLPVMNAEGFPPPTSNGCSRTENQSGCYYNVYCVSYIDKSIHTYQPIPNSNPHPYVSDENIYDEDGMLMGCSPDDLIYYNGNRYSKIHLKYKDTSSMVFGNSENIPRENLGHDYYQPVSPKILIVTLDLSDNQYSSYTPNLDLMENLSFLNLSSNYLTMARLFNPTELPALTDIDLSNNVINKIEVSSEHVYRKLKKLNISHNYLVDLPDAIFDAFTHLEILDLSHNFIDTLSISTFEGIKKLTSLLLSYNRITDINSSFFRFSDLEILDISHNRIVNLKLQDFEKLTKLQSIDLSSNSLISIESLVFSNMDALVSLDLRDNKLKILQKDTFINASSLKNVDISQNNFKSLQRGLFKGKRIQTFALSGNTLEGSLTSGIFDGLGLLTNFDLSHQYLTTIEDNAFLGLNNVNTLLLNNNKIQTIFKNGFRGLRHLHTLNLSNNNITNIDFDAQDLVNLRSIELSNNFLTQIKHENFLGLSLLQFLDLSNNKISNLESNSFKSLRDLVNFKISNNPLTGSLEEKTFDGLNSLPSLVISCTQLTSIKNGSFIGMTQLKELNMSQSKINELQYNAFSNTGAIEVIDLSYNQLRVFEVNSTELVNLRVLLLHKNLLKVISKSTFSGYVRITKLNLAHNNIKDISDEAFQTQNDLVDLDLSYNLDISFNDSIVSKNTNLLNLYLSGIRNGISFMQMEGTQLTDLEICYSGLTNITAINLKILSRLERVILSNNDVVRLDVGAFANVTQLNHLDISYNKLMFIQPGVFKDNIRLHSLNVSHNSLTTISYGIFRGLIYLNTLDMSFNGITSLESERFYEVRSLNKLIVDHNKIDTLSAEDFAGTSLSELSIGNNPLPCELLVNFKKTLASFAITAITLDEHTNENVDGVTCNMNGYDYKKKTNTSNLDESSKILIELRDILNKMAQQQIPGKNAVTEKTDTQNKNFEYLVNISKQIDQIYLKSDNNVSTILNSTLTLTKETKLTNVLLDKILSTLNRKVLTPTTPFPISKENASNDLILYINKVKEDLENTLAAEKLNIINELNEKISNLNTQIIPSTIIPKTPVHDKLTAVKGETEYSNTSSLFTETCVALILAILVCFILYKFYKSRMFVSARRSYSTRELPGAMESQNL